MTRRQTVGAVIAWVLILAGVVACNATRTTPQPEKPGAQTYCEQIRGTYVPAPTDAPGLPKCLDPNGNEIDNGRGPADNWDLDPLNP